MKQIMLAVALLAFSVPAFAQLGGFGGALKKAQESKQKVDDLTISDAEERQIGEDVSAKIRQRFGVVQDPAIHTYGTLLGTTLTSHEARWPSPGTRPNWPAYSATRLATSRTSTR